jgi:acyl-coenzyme A thioesterase PaaI-like protein
MMFAAGAGGHGYYMRHALRRALQQQQQQQQHNQQRRGGAAAGASPPNPSFRAPSPGGFAHAAAASTAVSAAAAGGPAAALAALLARGGTAAAGAAAAAGVRFAAAALLGGGTAAVALNSRADRRDVSTAAAAAAAASAGGASPSSSRGDAAVAGAWGGGKKRGGAAGGEAGTAAGTRDSDALAWVQALASADGVREVPLPGQMLRDHPIGRFVSEPDHLLANMVKSGQLREFRCFYDERKRLFHSVVLLGGNVAGYPSTLHGGATAAVVDETLGGLYTSLLAGGKLGATLPGLTKRLEVDYKRTAPTGGALLVTAEVESVEPRKVWMKASVRDGATGNEYATGRALFVAPHLGRMILRAMGLPIPGGKAAASELEGKGGGGGGGGGGSAARPASSPLGGGGTKGSRSEPVEEGGW